MPEAFEMPTLSYHVLCGRHVIRIVRRGMDALEALPNGPERLRYRVIACVLHEDGRRERRDVFPSPRRRAT